MPEEPECTCEQTDVDRFDASGCELHNPDSRWNRSRRQVEWLRMVYPELACEDYEEAPF